MATITLDSTVYKEAQSYAKEQNMSVDEFVVSLINKFVPKKKKKYRMKTVEELHPELQAIIGFAKPNAVDEDDMNGERARTE